MSTRMRGRPDAAYDPELVRDVCEQRMIAHWNANPNDLRHRMRKDPKFVPDKVRRHAALPSYEALARAWMTAVDYVPKDHPDYDREVTFWFWCSRLEPAETPETLKPNRDREVFLRKQNFFYNFDTNVKPWLDAIERVRHDRYLKLQVPTLVEIDEEWL
jgi:hypothetical protein